MTNHQRPIVSPAVALIDGISASGLPLDDRGLAYGDGVFETILVSAGRPVWWAEHLQRLRRGASVLGIEPPDDASWQHDFAQLSAANQPPRWILKLILTRGSGGRGYLPSQAVQPRRIALRLPAPDKAEQRRSDGIAVRWCATRLVEQPKLAGIKHLNRLEQVLARAEWQAPDIAEGLMRDARGKVICATSANLFVVSDRVLQTPALDRCGIDGVCRDFLIQHLAARIVELSEEDVLTADEVFVCNSVRGILPVVRLGGRRWSIGPITRQCMAQLANSHLAFSDNAD